MHTKTKLQIVKTPTGTETKQQMVQQPTGTKTDKREMVQTTAISCTNGNNNNGAHEMFLQNCQISGSTESDRRYNGQLQVINLQSDEINSQMSPTFKSGDGGVQ